MKKKIISLISCVSVMLGSFSGMAQAATYSTPTNTTNYIINTIKNEYSEELSNKIYDLTFDSDYSDIVSDGTTLRNYYSNGNTKSWPISNADSYGSSVIDRGEKVSWGWGCAGCMAYACFYSYSVYGTIGAKSADVVALDKDDASTQTDLKNYIAKKLQPGEHFRSNDKPHSVIYLCDGTENGKDGFYIAEYWGGAKQNDEKVYVYNQDNDQYYIRFYTYEDFVKQYSGTKWFAYDAYETSEFANDKPQDEEEEKSATRDIVLVLDISGSMSGSPLNNTKTAAKKFVDQILDNSHDTKIAVVTYDSYVETAISLTDDKDALKTAIDSLYDRGSTNMYSGLERAGELLENSNSDKKAVVIMTDGAANMGVSGPAGNITVQEGYDVYFTTYGSAIYDLSQTYINDNNYTIYSLGFGLSENSTAYNLIKYISSFNKTNERYFWSVTNQNIDDIIFTYEDIAETIVTKKNIIISIECPVEAQISYNGETLDKDNTQTSFGSVTVTDADDGNNYLFTLEDNRDYDINITGTGDGTMDMKVTYTEGDTEEHREFVSVPVCEDTKITTSATDRRADMALYVDSDGDGSVDEAWESGENTVATDNSADLMSQLYPEPVEEELMVYASPEGGTYKKAQMVELSANDDAVIYYTTDGSEPTEADNVYEEAIEISEDTELKFMAVKDDKTASGSEKYKFKKESKGGSLLATYEVTFDTNGGSSVSKQIVGSGNTVQEPADPEKEGYVFAGWYKDAELSEKYDFSEKVSGKKTIYAAWEQDENEAVSDETTEKEATSDETTEKETTETTNTNNLILLTIGKLSANVFGETKSNDVAPIIRNSRTMLPARFVAENLGAKVEWDADKRMVKVTGNNIKIVMYIDSDTAYIDGEPVTLDSPAFIENSRTYTPVRFIAEALGAKVEWNADTQQVSIIK